MQKLHFNKKDKHMRKLYRNFNTNVRQYLAHCAQLSFSFSAANI